MSTRDRASVVTAAVLCVVACTLDRHPAFRDLALVDFYRAIEPARSEIEALLREE